MPAFYKLVQAEEFLRPEGPIWAEYRQHFLAEGDSWFSLGTLNPIKQANLLYALEFSTATLVVQTAMPGDTLHHMSASSGDKNFRRLLHGRLAYTWSGILLSAGGNDLIDACQVAAHHPLNLRLLRRPDERLDAALGPRSWLSDEGWQTFAGYLRANLDEIIALRDSGPSKGRPVFMHTYAYPTPTRVGPGLGLKSWLLPSLTAMGIPHDDQPGVARALVDQLADLLLACAADQGRFPGLAVFDSRGLDIVPAAQGADGESGDWVNEIHLTHGGCRKLSRPWAASIEARLAAMPT